MCAVVLLAGCGEKKRARVPVPPPPDVKRAPAATAAGTATPQLPTFPGNAKPVYVETGLASWYGPPYHNRRGANGQIYDMHALTAAHRTLPLNSVARVTNVKTGSSAVVRITDRGPFIEGRMLDLSLEAAKQVDVWRAGVTEVKLEVMHAPAAIDQGGRWCVQIGAFSKRKDAEKLRDKLQRRYRTAQVIEFAGPTGDWVRIRPLGDDKQRAEEVLKDNKVSEGAAFLVRLD